jgi:ubiquinone/menaquinone biosynthesis C-methylase UbiE
MNTLQQAFGNLSGGRVLDVATGNGNFVGVLTENLRDYAEIIGIDTNARALDAARENFKQDNIHFQVMDATRLEFPDASFDTVGIAYSLHHLENLPQAFVEIQRVWKPGGQLIIAEMYRDNQTETQLSHVYLHHWCAAIDSALGVSHRETYTRQQILDQVSELELRDCQFYDYADLEQDPKDAQNINRLDAALDQYIERAKNMPNVIELRARSDEIRARIHSIGFYSATILIVVGRK